MTKSGSEILNHHFTSWSDTRKGKLEMLLIKEESNNNEGQVIWTSLLSNIWEVIWKSKKKKHQKGKEIGTGC